MRTIQVVVPFDVHQAGDVIEVEDQVACDTIAQGYAVPSVEQAKAITAAPENKAMASAPEVK